MIISQPSGAAWTSTDGWDAGHRLQSVTNPAGTRSDMPNVLNQEAGTYEHDDHDRRDSGVGAVPACPGGDAMSPAVNARRSNGRGSPGRWDGVLCGAWMAGSVLGGLRTSAAGTKSGSSTALRDRTPYASCETGLVRTSQATVQVTREGMDGAFCRRRLRDAGGSVEPRPTGQPRGKWRRGSRSGSVETSPYRGGKGADP